MVVDDDVDDDDADADAAADDDHDHDHDHDDDVDWMSFYIIYLYRLKAGGSPIYIHDLWLWYYSDDHYLSPLLLLLWCSWMVTVWVTVSGWTLMVDQ